MAILERRGKGVGRRGFEGDSQETNVGCVGVSGIPYQEVSTRWSPYSQGECKKEVL